MGLKIFFVEMCIVLASFWQLFDNFLVHSGGGSESFKRSRRGETRGILKGIYSKGYPTSSARGPSYRSFGIASHGPGNGSAGRRICNFKFWTHFVPSYAYSSLSVPWRSPWDFMGIFG